MTWTPDIVIYHDHCADGFGAAWACWRRWGDAPAYLAASYGQTPPDVAGRNVLIVDFSYKRAVLEDMLASANSIIVLDHHKTAQEDLAGFQRFKNNPERFTLAVIAQMHEDLRAKGYPSSHALFDMNRSGARLAWDFCHPGQQVPLLVNLIQDRDLWRFAIPNSKAFALWLRSEPFTFERFDTVAADLEEIEDSQIILAEARAMQRFFDAKVAEIAAFAEWRPIGQHRAIAVSCPPMFASEVGHSLLEQYPAAAFAATFYDTKSSRMWSLRSQDHREDVSAIAARFGGGGHRNAAGFTVPAF